GQQIPQSARCLRLALVASASTLRGVRNRPTCETIMKPHPAFLVPALSLVLVLVSPGRGRSADNWPQFRCPSGDGHRQASCLPLRWSEKENIVWKTAIHDKGWSSPVIWGQQIWMTTAREDGKELFAVCVDRDSGKILHDVKLFDVPKPAFCHVF